MVGAVHTPPTPLLRSNNTTRRGDKIVALYIATRDNQPPQQQDPLPKNLREPPQQRCASITTGTTAFVFTFVVVIAFVIVITKKGASFFGACTRGECRDQEQSTAHRAGGDGRRGGVDTAASAAGNEEIGMVVMVAVVVVVVVRPHQLWPWAR